MRHLSMILVALLMSVSTASSDDCIFTIADDDSLKTALSDFHDVMAMLIHGPVEEGKIEPVRVAVNAAANDLMTTRDAVLKANLPKEFAHKCAEISAVAKSLSDAIDRVIEVSKQDDFDEVQKAFDAMHDAYGSMVKLTIPLAKLMDKFHDVMHPLWHEAYEAKDIKRLSEGVYDLKKYAKLLMQNNTGKPGDMETISRLLLEAVEKMEAACAEGKEEAVLSAMERVHELYHDLEAEI